jgi:hypothetical protein
MSRSALTTLIVIIAIIVIGGVVIASMRPPGVVAPGQTVAPSPTVSGGEPVTACTLDAKICPDGSAVGRIPPTCEFAACPAPQTTPTPKPSVSTSVQSTTTVQVGLNQKVTVNSLSFTPVEVIEDSRCPVGVMCIQAGTVRVRSTVLVSGSPSSSAVFVLNTPQKIGNATVTLSEVLPIKRQESIPPADYRFTFIVR